MQEIQPLSYCYLVILLVQNWYIISCMQESGHSLQTQGLVYYSGVSTACWQTFKTLVASRLGYFS